MTIHDWTRVDSGLYHDFHQDWTVELCRALNASRLPSDFSALIAPQIDGPSESKGGQAMASPPKARFIVEGEANTYARRANRIRIQHSHGKVVAIIEIVSPGNKSSQNSLRSFVHKASDLIEQGIHLLIVDLFPPSDRDPQGIHKAIWDEFEVVPFELPPDKPLTIAAYCASPTKTAYIEPVAVGDDLPSLPIFLTDDFDYIPAPLEETYRASWAAFPAAFKPLLARTPPN